MSKMKTDRKPPLPKSPMRLRPRRVLRSNSNSIQTPPASLTKTQVPNMEESELRPEYHSISCELRALAKMVRGEFGNGDPGNVTHNASSSPLFERGRLYDEYCARRNERLKRKKGETGDERKTPHNLGVTVESVKRRDSKKLESLRKSIPATFSVDRSGNSRYMLRSGTEKRKPPLFMNSEKPAVGGDRKIGARRVRKI